MSSHRFSSSVPRHFDQGTLQAKCWERAILATNLNKARTCNKNTLYNCNEKLQELSKGQTFSSTLTFKCESCALDNHIFAQFEVIGFDSCKTRNNSPSGKKNRSFHLEKSNRLRFWLTRWTDLFRLTSGFPLRNMMWCFSRKLFVSNTLIIHHGKATCNFMYFFIVSFHWLCQERDKAIKKNKGKIISWNVSNNMKGKRVKSFVSFGSDINHVDRTAIQVSKNLHMLSAYYRLNLPSKFICLRTPCIIAS